MPTTVKINPVTRVEGHIAVEVTIDSVNGSLQVIDAKCDGTVFRGFEMILKDRDPLDAPHFTQRICGVCPISHSLASSLNLEAAFGITAPNNGRILRNLILASNFLQSHVLHFYHLGALDYIDTTGILDIAPWGPRYAAPDMVKGATAVTLVSHYVKALEIRRKAHQMAAIIGGRMPFSPALVAGGCTESPTAQQISDFRTLLTEIRQFIDNTYLPDVLAVAGAFPQYYDIGRGWGNLMAYGVFDLNAAGTSKLLKRGRITNGQNLSLNTSEITEYVKYSKYTAASGNLNPASGNTIPDAAKAGAYSWIKSPRYLNLPHEAGPLARMMVNGDYTNGISVIDRIAARAYETKKVADAMDGWLNQIVIGAPVYTRTVTPLSATGIGLTEAPRGALGHWMTISNYKIASYQVITPTNWNASPRDDFGNMGPIEKAMVGTPVANIKQPIEVLRVIHSFDPCLACAVHMVRPDSKKIEAVVYSQPSI